jgi:hypothetical protein
MEKELRLAIPHQELLDELQIGLLAIAGQLPLLSSIFRWTQSALEKKDSSHRLGWMIVVDKPWTPKDQIDRFITLKRSVHSLHSPLQSLISDIKDFSPFPKIQDALQNFEKIYKSLPLIEPELHLLSLGQTLLENKELIPHFIAYIEHVAKLEECGRHLYALRLTQVFSIIREPIS